MKDTIKYVIYGICAIAVVVGLVCLVISITRIPTGYEGVVYSMSGGVQDETLSQGWHLVSPTKKVKTFTIGNEQLILSKDERDGSKGDDSFKVSTSDDASLAISFQMSYRYIPGDIVNTYKKFKGMDGEDIVEKRIKTVLKSKISEVTTDYSMMDIYSGNRAEINTKITDYLNDKFSSEYGIEVFDASIIDVHPDEKLKKAIDDRVTALQNKQKAQADQETAKVEAQTALIKAQNEADIKVTKAKADAESKKIAAEAEAESNKKISQSIDQQLIDYKIAEARYKHGWVTVQGAEAIVTESNK